MSAEVQLEVGPSVPKIYRRHLVDHDTFRLMRASRDWLAANAHRRITLAEAAARAGFSPFHFHRLFQRAFGETPQEFVTRLRMDRAKRSLRTSVDSVSEICFEVGYESIGTFSSLFRREVGVPPSQFRRIFQAPDLWALKSTPACFRRLM